MSIFKKNIGFTQFSVSMSVYKNDNAIDFYKAVQSVINQSVQPSELVLVVDGPIGVELEQIVGQLQNETDIIILVRLPINKGHAIARQTGIEHCSNDLIAIMDSDDISDHNRFEKQLNVFKTNPTVSIVGGQISEFIDDVDNVLSERIVPENDLEIKKYMKSRCPFNQVTVMFKKRDVLSVGGYLDWYCNEDYYLWVRMSIAGFTFMNVPESLVSVRVGTDMYSRRGGLDYFLSEARLQKYMWTNKIIGPFRLIFNVFIRLIVQVIIPNTLRAYIFKNVFRKTIKE